MNDVNGFVFWQNAPSIHFAPIIREIANLGYETHVITEFPISSARAGLGWSHPSFGEASYHSTPSAERRRDLERKLGNGFVHVFQSAGVYPATRESMERVGRMSPRRMAVVSEPWNPHGLHGRLRKLRFRRLIGRLPGQVDTHLLMGGLARAQWSALGVSRNDVFPCIYCVDILPSLPGVPPAWPQMSKATTKIAYVGNLIPRKRVDLLIDAIRLSPPTAPVSLIIAGAGPDSESLKSRCGESQNIAFAPAMENSKARQLMANSDIVVLPSDFDGWGAVVNEALSEGAFVIVSDRAGASELVLGDRSRGSVFVGGSVESLAAQLRIAVDKMGVRNASARRLWADGHISPAAIAKYVVNVLERERLTIPERAPWL